MKMTALALTAATLALTAAAVDVAEPMTTLELKPSTENCRNSEGDFALLKDERILFVCSHYVKGTGGNHDPAHLASRVFRDDGKTRPIRRTLKSDMTGWYCYVAALELDGDLLLGCCARDNLRHSRVKLVPLDWLYAAKDHVEIVK